MNDRIETPETRADSGCVSLYVTVESENVAVHMASELVKEDLVACVNVFDGVRSVYKWDGMVQIDNEVVMIAKTTRSMSAKAIARIKELHNYDVPCITIWPIEGGEGDYLGWVRETVDPQKRVSN
ncbi:divalent-cation tolerance protein CutA [Yunchengibacter salinarum]|uniref:divalent-cation tolerance protein CutA n=1 Tax=Yunchengibacter salinarum TaxID=3133399 RepID=UPI0035B5C880